MSEERQVPARRRARVAVWRSPPDQPSWARPAVLALTVLAGFLYAWKATGNLEVFYAAAVRSMSMSWHDFLFAAFDPAGTVTVDKLPGAFWIQALFVRVFGVHAWAIVAPQVIEGMASVLVLYRVVRRLAGAAAGILAALVFVISPATVALNRGNISDTLMVLLLLLAADATVSAVLSGRTVKLVLAGVFVGLAFQAKMIEAWLLLPALALAYATGGPGRWPRRVGQLACSGAVVGAVSLCWMVFVALWPAAHRPYVDGSHTNSIFSQVFVYNGFGRLDQASPNQLLTRAIGLRLGSAPAGWHRLLSGTYGRDTAWLIPAALIALVACLVAGRWRRDLLRTGCVLWGLWLLVLLVVFSASSTINAYYTAALTPAIAALLGMGAAVAYERRASVRVRLLAAAVVLVSCVYAIALVPGHGVGLVAGLSEAIGVIGLLALLAMVRPIRALSPALAMLAVVLAPAVASASVVAKSFGPFDTPFEGPVAAGVARALGGVAHTTDALLPPLETAQRGAPDLMATQTSAVAAPFIYDSGREVLPIGGFTGTIPEPSLERLKAMVAAGDFHLVIQAPVVTDPRLQWVARTCFPVPTASGAPGALRFSVYYCGRRPIL